MLWPYWCEQHAERPAGLRVVFAFLGHALDQAGHQLLHDLQPRSCAYSTGRCPGRSGCCPDRGRCRAVSSSVAYASAGSPLRAAIFFSSASSPVVPPPSGL